MLDIFPETMHYIKGHDKNAEGIATTLSWDSCYSDKGFPCKVLRDIATCRENTVEVRVRVTILYLLGSVVVDEK